MNHLEGRTTGFFCYGDGGGELDPTGRPKLLRHPEYFDPDQEPFDDMRQTYAPLVWQCRYSGIEVPDALWRYTEFGRGRKYSDNQAEDMPEQGVWASLRRLDRRLLRLVAQKGQVPPGRHRAHGYEPPATAGPTSSSNGGSSASAPGIRRKAPHRRGRRRWG